MPKKARPYAPRKMLENNRPKPTVDRLLEVGPDGRMTPRERTRFYNDTRRALKQLKLDLPPVTVLSTEGNCITLLIPPSPFILQGLTREP